MAKTFDIEPKRIRHLIPFTTNMNYEDSNLNNHKASSPPGQFY